MSQRNHQKPLVCLEQVEASGVFKVACTVTLNTPRLRQIGSLLTRAKPTY